MTYQILSYHRHVNHLVMIHHEQDVVRVSPFLPPCPASRQRFHVGQAAEAGQDLNNGKWLAMGEGVAVYWSSSVHFGVQKLGLLARC